MRGWLALRIKQAMVRAPVPQHLTASLSVSPGGQRRGVDLFDPRCRCHLQLIQQTTGDRLHNPR